MTRTETTPARSGPKVAAALVALAVAAVFASSLLYRVEHPGMQKMVRAPQHDHGPEAGGMPGGGAGPGAGPGMDMEAVRGMVEKLQARVTADPADVEALLQLAEIQRMRGDVEAANQYLDAALEHAGGNPDALHELAGIYYELERNDKARQALETVLTGNPGDGYARFNLGVLYRYRLKDAAKAGEQYRAVLGLDGFDDVKEQARNELETLERGN